jgi:hypothetical protein
MDERKLKNNQVFKNKTCEMAEEKERHQKPNISGNSSSSRFLLV